jgi:hypothetical protein
MKLSVRVALLAILLTHPGCGGDDAGPDCSDLGVAPALTLGGTTLTQDAYVAIDDGDILKVIITGAGLFALPPSLRMQGLWPGEADRAGHADDPIVAIRAHVGSTYVGGTDVSTADGTTLDVAPNYGFTPIADGSELVAVPVIFLDGIEPLDYLNETVTLTATVTDACQRSASDELDVVAFWQY